MANFKHKLTREIEAILNDIAKQLPKAVRSKTDGTVLLVRKELSGSQMIAMGERLPGNSKIHPNRIYTVHVTVPVDHKDNLIYRYKQGGMAGVTEYVDLVNHFERLRKDREIKGLPWYTQLWWLIKDAFSKHTAKIPGV